RSCRAARVGGWLRRPRSLRPGGAMIRALGLALLLVAPSVRAQDASDEARAEFIRGTRALDEGRIADGLACFERSYALSGNPAALFNVVRTLASVGRPLETIDAADRLLREHPALAADLRARAEA